MNRGSRIWVAALAVLVSAPSTAHAQFGNEGEPAFGISAYFQTPPRLNEATTILVRIWGEDSYEQSITSVARISLPDGIELVSGDTVSVAHVYQHSRKHAQRVFQIVIRPVRPGSYMIRGWLGIDAGEERGADETDFHLTLDLGADTVTYARAPRATRFENVRHGQRYRYAGRYLVPIDSTQALLEEEITDKAKPELREPAICPGCPGPLPTVVPFVVMVGSDGRIRESRFVDMQEEGTMDGSLVAAAAQALRRWEFEPARAGDHPVADYVVVRVPVLAGQP
ncbi:MAG TPA: hypothetical protein VK527_07710 [Candidatus Limnocylindrales bacterium]|nr:hypothetical protein [Candidatus Limnocylindrales bacterium]